jgi:Tfp pilus assembly pilus retraction ATPase PilT
MQQKHPKQLTNVMLKTIEEGMKTVKQKLTDTKNKLMTEINAAAAAQKAIQKEGWRQLVKSVRKRQEY